MKQHNITRDELKSLLAYEDGVLYKTRNGTKVVAGWINKTLGVRYIRIRNIETTYARAVWFYFNGQWPSGELLHINGNSLDDRIENLRIANEWYAEPLDQDRLKHLIDYDPATGMLTWRHSKKMKGKPAGYANEHGYGVVNIAGQDYRAHWLAWMYVHGRWPLTNIDHITGVPSDNRISNLREATHAQNMANPKLPKTNKSGYKGVSWHAQAGKWQAHIKHQGTNHYLGHFSCPKEAHAVYADAAKRLNGEFARKFTNDH